MSTSWDIYCLDCQKVAVGFNDCRDVALLRALIGQAEGFCVLARSLEVLKKMSSVDEVSVKAGFYKFYPEEFLAHAGHRLLPRTEYGSFDEECGVYFRCCEACDREHTCRLPKHTEGSHAVKRP